VTAVRGKRVSVAALVAGRPGHRAQLVYRTRAGPGSGTHQRKSFTKTDYGRLLAAAHQELSGAIILIWDNLPTHVSRKMRRLIAARSWLTVFQLPGYTPELNPVEAAWSVLKRPLANLTKQGIDQLTALVKTRLKRMQYRPGLIDGFLARTGTGRTRPLRGAAFAVTARDAVVGALSGPDGLTSLSMPRPAVATQAVGVADAPEGARRRCEAGPATQRIGKVISDGDREGGGMPVLLPARHRPVGCREWWLSCTPVWSAQVAADSAAWSTQN
jgi:putative transposase